MWNTKTFLSEDYQFENEPKLPHNLVRVNKKYIMGAGRYLSELLLNIFS